MEQIPRPTRQVLHMLTAFMWAQRSEDPRLKVGAVITSYDLRRILSFGYNGLAKGLDPEYIGTTPGESGCLHAEDNALTFCDSTIPDKRLFVTHAPCVMCTQRIINAGFYGVTYCLPYRDPRGLKLLNGAGIEVLQMDFQFLQDQLSLLTLRQMASTLGADTGSFAGGFTRMLEVAGTLKNHLLHCVGSLMS